MTDRIVARTLRALVATAAVIAVLFASGAAHATVDGTAPSPFRSFRVFGDSLSVGNTLMRNLPSQPLVNSLLLSSSTARVSGVPTGAAVEGAYIFWTGSVDPDIGVDRAARFTLPNGASRIVPADTCYTATAQLGPGAGSVDYFYCRADVTTIVASNPTGTSYNGVYGVGDVSALPGFLGTGGQCLDSRCQAFYAGWSMVMVWSSEDESTLRDVAMFDGFQLYDETQVSAAVSTYTIGGFDVADPPEATFRFFGLEGDALLGVPPQDSDPTLRCTTCFDYVAFNGDKLEDSLNPANNLFNSTLPEGSAIGVDIDSFDVSDLVRPGDASVRIEVGSGDGNPRTGHANGAGGGELFLLGYNVLTINRLAPSFRNRDSFIVADPTEASPGEVVFYTVQLTNTGSLPAEDVVAQVPLPPNTEYVPGSTRLDGVAVADVGGASPLFGGMGLGEISNVGDNDRRITFRVRILPDTPNGTRIESRATFSADSVEDTVTEPAVVIVVAPTLQTPFKTALDLNGGALEPGDFVTYTIRLRKDPERSAAGLTFIDDISPYARLQSVNAGGFTDASNLTGGANGTGRVEVRDISMPTGAESVTLSFTVRMATTAELIDAGVDPGAIDGLLVRNQGALSADFLPDDLLTDNPATGASPDPTDLRLSSSVNFRNASTFKSSLDVNGGFLEPGDTVRFTISLRNAGNQAATISLSDALPAGTTNPRFVSTAPGFSLTPPPGGAFGAGSVDAFNVSVGARTTVAVVLDVDVADDATNGTVIENVAQLTVDGFPDQNQALNGGELVVRAGASFDDATKTAEGEVGGYEPGDTVTYRIGFTNSGNQDGRSVVVTDVVAPNLTAIAPQNGGVYDSRTRTITWNVGDVPVGGRTEVAFQARIAVDVPDGTAIANQAFVSGDGTTSFPSDDPTTAGADDPTVIRVAAVAAPDAEKSVTDLNGGAFEPGDRIRYTLVVRNDGRAALTNVRVVDPLPSAALEDFAPGQGGALTGDTVTWSPLTTPSLASIAPGGSATLTVEATIAAGVPNGEVVSNQATVTSGAFELFTDDPTTGDLDDPTRFTVAAEADLTLSEKTVEDENGGAPQPGDRLTYSIVVRNSGSGAARDVVVTDPVPAGLIEITPLDGGLFDASAGAVVWTPTASIAPGTDLTLRFQARIAPGTANGTVIANQARIQSADAPGTAVTDDPSTGTPDDPTAITVESRPDFATSTKEVFHGGGGTEFRPGDPVVYRIVVANTGTEDATNVVVRDPLDSALVDVELDAGGAVEGGDAVWRLPSLAAGEQQVLTIQATLGFPLEDGRLVSNQAFISAPGVADEPTDNPVTAAEDDPTTFEVLSRADLSASIKTFVDANGGSVRPGDRIEYVVVVLNTGTQDAVDVVIDDVLDPNLIDVDPGTGVYDAGSNRIRWSAATTPSLSRVAVGEAGAVELRFSATVGSPIDNGTRIANQATLTVGDETFVTDDPNTAPPSDPTAFQVISAFDFSDALKRVSPSEPGGYRPGDAVTYSIRFTNTGDSAGTDVTVTDPLDANLVFVSATAGGVFDGASVRWTSATLPQLARVAPGDVVEVSVTALIASPLANGTIVSNQALITATGGAEPFVTDDPATGDVDDPTDITVVSAPNLSTTTKTVEDTDGDGVFEPGDEVLYTIVVQNSGDGVANQVSVRDLLPDGLTGVRPLDGGRLQGEALVWDAATTPRLAGVVPGAAGAVSLRFLATIEAGTTDGTLIANQAFVSTDTIADVPTDDPSNGLGDDNPTVVRVVAQPRLDGFTKSAVDLNGEPLQAGDRVRYTLTLTNEGTQPAFGVSVTDAVDANLTDVEALDGGVFDGDTVRWTFGDMGVGETRVVTFEATIRAGVADGTAILNQAFAQSDSLPPAPSDDPATADEDDATVLVVNALPEISAAKTITDLNGDFLSPGDRVRYTIEVRNDGAGDAERITINDVIPTLLEDVEPLDGGRVVGPTVVWDVGGTPALERLAPGATAVVRFDATVPAGTENSTEFANQAAVEDASGESIVTDDPATAEADDPTVGRVFFPELDAATLEVTDLNGGSVEPGDVLSYRLRIAAGAGPALTNVTAELNVDPRLGDVLLLSGGVWDEATRRITWSPADTAGLDLIATNGSVLLEFEVTVDGTTAIGAVIAAQARVASDEVPFGVVSDDPSTPEVDDPTVVEVFGDVLAVLDETTKTVVDLNGGTVEPGDVLEYTIVILNSGEGRTAGLSVLDSTPPLTTYVPDSLTVDGETIAGDANPLAPGLQVNDLGPDQTRELRFRVQVNEDAPSGARIDNVAIASELGGAVAPSDDPTTAALDDPTSVIIGSVPDLSRTQKQALLVDENNDGAAQVGETLRYVIDIPNTGAAPATGVELSDALPSNVTPVPGTLALNGASLTDAAGDDAGEIVTVGDVARVRVVVGTIEVDATATVTFDVTITGGAQVANQGFVGFDGGVEPTDDDGNPANGDRPTVTPLNGATIATATKAVADADGGAVEPGDTLLYTIVVRSTGQQGAFVIEDTLDPGAEFVRVVAEPAGVAVELGAQDALLSVAPFEEGGERIVVIEATLSADIEDGTVVCNTIESAVFESPDPACVTVGAEAGFARVNGTVFRELGPRNGVADADTDELLDGYLVRVARADAPEFTVADALSDAEGAVTFRGLSPATYLVEAYANGGPDFGGALFVQETVELAGGALVDQPLPIDPTGVIYDAESRRPVAGVRVWLYEVGAQKDVFDETRTIPADTLPFPSQQGQIVPANGVYRFDLPAGRDAEIFVDTAGSNFVFPSTRILADEDGAVAAANERLELVDAALPDEVVEGEERYALRIAAGDEGGVFKNHVPVDAIDSAVTLTKRADRVAARVGDIITYTISVRNESGADLVFDPNTRTGGVIVHDAIPQTFRYVDGSAVGLVRDLTTGETEPVSVWSRGQLLLQFGTVRDTEWSALSLPAGSELEIRYFLAVGSDTEPGRTERNRAELRSADTDTLLSNVDYVDVRIEYDPVFDQGVLMGRAFCDLDGDGRFDRGETGLPGARIYLDAGYYTETDGDGQYHFSEIDPGLHLVKVDAHTLPVGSTIVSDEARAFNVTRGLPSLIDFAIECNENLVTDIEVLPGDGALAEATRLRRARYVDVVANVRAGTVAVDGVDVPMTQAQMWLGAGTIPDAPAPAVPAPIVESGITEDATEADTDGQPLFESASTPTADAGTEPVDTSDDETASEDAVAVTPRGPLQVERAVVDLRVADGALVAPLGVRAAMAADVDRWVFEVAEPTTGTVVYQRAGTSVPNGGVTFEWDGTNEDGALVLQGQRVYEARLRALAGQSSYAAAAPVLLRVSGTRERYLVEERVSDAGFAQGRPDAELREVLDGLREELSRTAPHRVVVEAHVDDREELDDADGLTQSQAEAVAAYLVNTVGVARGRIEPRGMGIRRPLYPNIGDRTRTTNRRVEVRVIAPEPDILTPSLPTLAPLAPGVRMGEQSFDANGDAVIEASVLRPADGVLPATVTREDGGTSAVLVALREGVRLERPQATVPEVDVEVNLETGRVAIAEASIALASLDTRVSVEPAAAVLQGRMLEPTLRFPFEGVPDNVDSWRFEVFEAGGSAVFDESGEGPPPGGRRWQGRTSDGIPLTAGAYEARLTLRLRGGGLATSAPVSFDVLEEGSELPAEAASTPEPPTDDAALVRINGRTVEGRGDVFGTRVRAVSGSTVLVDIMKGGARVVVPVTVPEGHEASFGGTVSLEPFSIVVDAGAPPVDGAEENSVGEDDEAQDDAPSRRGRRGREPSDEPAESEQPAASEPATNSPFAPATGGPALPSRGESPEAAPSAPEEAPEAEDEAEDEGDEEPAAPVVVPAEEEPAEPDAAPSPFAPVSDGRWLLTRPAAAPSFQLMQAENPFSPFAPSGGGEPAAAPSDEPAQAPAEAPSEVSPEAPNVPDEPEAPAASPAPTAPEPAAAAPPRYTDLLDFYARELDAALATDTEDLSAALAAAEAGVISVQLPPQGLPLQSNRLSVFGETVPTNRVWVNGEEVNVARSGRFDHVVELPGGVSDVVVETLDTAGNRGRLEWPVEVNNSSFFLMALADTAIGSRDADIAGTHDHNSRTTDSGVLLYGQARLYFKGWVSGQDVLDGQWDDIEITAHVDTGKRREFESFVRETIQPDRQYPVFGDGSEEVSDVNSRGKVYLLVTADDSSATWGNFNTEIRGVELLRYERNLYGAQVELDETIAENYRTELQFHVADEDESIVQTYNFLRGTGGSIYYLQNRQVLEGSERVALIVRDRVSGVELARIPQSRNVDYTMRYGEGRIVMRSPVPSVADDGLLLGDYVTSRNLLRGHPVYLEVAYDYEGGVNGSDLSYGAHGRETFFDLVTIGGGVVEESRVGAPGYSLWGIEAAVHPTANSRVEFEYAASQSDDLGYSYSDDGGLTFDRFRLEDGRDDDGTALLVRGTAELADVLDTERSEIWNVGGYYQRSDRGFFSNGRILDQGEEKFGLSSRLHMNDVNSLAFRLDRVTSQVEDLTSEEEGDLAQLRRQVAQVQYEYEFDPARFTLSYQHTYSDDARLEDGYTNDVVGAGVEARVTRWLRLGLEQELIVNGDDPNVIRGAGGDTDTRLEDRFITSVNAGVQVHEDVEIVATERFRYSGENAAMVGLRAGVGDNADAYVQQRFTNYRDTHGSAMSTVVGGEQRYGADGSGRTYGEYHVDHGVSTDRTRAVLGFGKRWNVAEGLSIDAGFERSHTLAGESVQSGSSRNTFSFGWEYVGLDVLKLSGLFEVRFDRGSTHSPATGACLGDDITGNPVYCRDQVTAVGDRRQIVSMTSLVLTPTEDLTFFGRVDIVHTENTTLNIMESRDAEATVGVALRPVDFNWLNLLMRYTYLAEMAPYQLELDQRRDEQSHVFSLSPIIELPFNLQLVEKVAVRHIELDVEGMPRVNNDLILLINRLNYHLFRQWDVGAEYRFLRQSLTQDWRHGLLLDVNYIVAEHVRIGVGYNFTRFAEDELGDFDRDASGVFFRVSAQY